MRYQARNEIHRHIILYLSPRNAISQAPKFVELLLQRVLCERSIPGLTQGKVLSDQALQQLEECASPDLIKLYFHSLFDLSPHSVLQRVDHDPICGGWMPHIDGTEKLDPPTPAMLYG
ncbi:hypothetical protein FZEAL_5758 [Fusarium zealandicum]|uniref:Uncharacterized protein n=1 Tax=Fusarium zealandicum TaxID=1053134 RepID=A0A8H4UJ37_9HYPO|nr:hypothetical protein FZEAL_5758 [Fusarium zealandicum]